MNIGVIGVNTTQTKEQVFPGNLAFKANGKTLEIKISDSRERIQSAVTAVKKAGADVVVALIHEGFSQTSNGKATGKLID